MGGQHGSTVTEYALLLVLAAALAVVLLATPVGDHVVALVRAGICQIAPVACGPDSGLADEEFVPAACAIATSTVGGSLDLTVGLLDVGAGIAFARVDRSDGTVAFTLVDDGRVGLTAGVGGEVRLGFAEGHYDASADAGMVGRAGDTWIVPAGEADDLERRLVRGEALRRTVGRVTPAGEPIAGWLADRLFGVLGPPDVSFAGAGVKAHTEGRASLVNALERHGEIRAGGGFAALLGAEVDRSDRDPANWTVTTYVETDLVARGDIEAFAGQLGGERGLTSVVKETRREHTGELVQVELVTTASASHLRDVRSDLPQFATLLGSDQRREVVETVTIPLDDPTDRAGVDRWLSTLDPRNDAPLWDLARRRATVSLAVYDGEAASLSLGARLAMLAKIGGFGAATVAQAGLVSAHYLGAPDAAGQRAALPFTDCLASAGR